MKDKPLAQKDTIPQATVGDIIARLTDGRPIRQKLPDHGELLIDRPLPFLCVYRQPRDMPDPGTAELVRGEASYLIMPGTVRRQPDWTALLAKIVSIMVKRYDAFLFVEIWSSPSRPPAVQDASEVMETQEVAALCPGFRLAARGTEKPRSAVEMLIRSLRPMVINGLEPVVEIDDRAYGWAPAMPPLLSTAQARRLHCHFLGIEVKPIYRHAETGEIFPKTIRVLRRGLSRALKRTFFTFARTHTTAKTKHYQALGRRALVKAVWEVDRRLASVGDSFDLLWQLTPINASAAWLDFKRSGFERAPEFRYRPLAVEPADLKRRLFSIPIEKIDDPTLSHLFLQRQDELDRKITMLADIGTPRLLHGSVQVHGAIEPALLHLAKELIEKISPRSREPSIGRSLGAEEFAQRARNEIEWYRAKYPDFAAKVAVCDDLYWGLLVSGETLMIGRQTKVPAARVEPLLQHELGTHLLTYYNGRAQPFRQLHCGLAGYEPLQEGLAVLAEHFSGTIGGPRLRTLAARVLACQMLLDGASFVETFRILNQQHGFPKRLTYTISMRVFRGGGTVKDAIYLRGLLDILRYLGEGGELEPLFLGKIAAEHVPLIRELRMRRVLGPPSLIPRYMDNTDVSAKLQRLRQGLSVFDLLKPQKRKR